LHGMVVASAWRLRCGRRGHQAMPHTKKRWIS
jgi:hypothetical protein